MVSVQALADIGLTMPVVPRMERPPMIPSRALRVFIASSSPLGMLMDEGGGWGLAMAKTSLTTFDHPARHRVDGPLAYRHRQSRLGDPPDAGSPFDDDPSRRPVKHSS